MPCCDKKKELLVRIARVEGHLRKVKSMIEEDSYCIDVITQSLAVQSALRSIDEIVLTNHMRTCVKDAMASDKGIDEKISEVVRTLQFMRK